MTCQDTFLMKFGKRFKRLNIRGDFIMVLNEKDYPMTYKEFEQRVIDLFLENYEGKTLEIMMGRLDGVLDESPNFIEQLYGYNCFIYESPHIYGENCKKSFEDDFLRQTPVAQLRLLIG